MTGDRDAPSERGRLGRWLNRSHVVALICIVALLGAFSLYSWREGRRLEAEREGQATDEGDRRVTPGGGAIPTIESASARAARGETTWGQFCASCHVVPAGAAAAMGPVLLSREYLAFATDQRLDSLILHGVPGTTMIGWGRGGGGILNPAEVKDVIAFLRARQPQAPSDPGWKGGRRVPIP